MQINADLHIHSTVSPCASLYMSPTKIAQQAKKIGLDLIALTDHNSAKNCPAFISACKKYNLEFLCGIEVTSKEEAHILCLFDNIKTTMALEKIVYNSLPNIKNKPEKLGDQVFVNEKEEILGEIEKYLISASDLSIDELNDFTKKNNGLIIPSHVDRPIFSLIAQLGFIPETHFDAIEIYRSKTSAKNIAENKHTIISNSDAHTLNEIGKTYTCINAKNCSISEIKKALNNNNVQIKHQKQTYH